MPALLRVSTWLFCLIGFIPAVHAGHPSGDQKSSPDQEKKIEIRVQVHGDDVQIEALEDGKKVDLDKLADQIHGLLKQMPTAKVEAEVEAIVAAGDDAEAGAKKSIQKIIKIVPHGDPHHSSADHKSADAHDVIKSILQRFPQDGQVRVQVQQILQSADDDDDDDDDNDIDGDADSDHEEHEAAEQRGHEHAQHKIKVLLHQLDEDGDDAQEAKKMLVLQMKDHGGEADAMRWFSQDHNQIMFSPDSKHNMVFLGSHPSGKFKLGVALVPIGDLVRAQLHIAEDTGLAVESVFDNSPAAKSGLRKYDIIEKIGDADVRELGDLLESIEKAGESNSAVRLTILRAGERQTIEVMPESNKARVKAKRQVDWTEKTSETPRNADSWQDLQKQLQELRAAVEELRKARDE